MPEEKEHKEQNWLERHWTKLLYILLPIVGMGAWELIQDVFITGTEVKHQQLVVNIVVTDKTIDDWARNIAKEEILFTMEDASTWVKVLDNKFLDDYTESKVQTVKADIDRKISQIDSAQHNLINDIGKMAGIRNDEFVKIFSSMIREYKKEHIDIVHVPTM